MHGNLNAFSRYLRLFDSDVDEDALRTFSSMPDAKLWLDQAQDVMPGTPVIIESAHHIVDFKGNRPALVPVAPRSSFDAVTPLKALEKVALLGKDRGACNPCQRQGY